MSYVPHLYDAQPRHVQPEPAPVFTAERIRPEITDEQVQMVMAALMVLSPLALALAGWSM